MFAKKISKVLRGKKRPTFNPYGNDIPAVVTETIQWLEKNAITTEGLFRVSGNHLDVVAMKKLFERTTKPSGVIQPNTVPHVVSGVIKLWLMELPDPLLTFPLYDSFIAAMSETDPDVMKLGNLQNVIALLPPCNAVVLKKLLRFLSKVDSNKSKN